MILFFDTDHKVNHYDIEIHYLSILKYFYPLSSMDDRSLSCEWSGLGDIGIAFDVKPQQASGPVFGISHADTGFFDDDE